jgi:hypothetical protein
VLEPHRAKLRDTSPPYEGVVDLANDIDKNLVVIRLERRCDERQVLVEINEMS